jgi:SAM-dependent methyltransferase
VGAGSFLENEARGRTFEIHVIAMERLEEGMLPDIPAGTFDGCILYCSLETVSDPAATLNAIRRLLKPSGTLMVTAPTLDSRTARIFRSQWWEFHRCNRFYFSADTLQSLLIKAGYGDPIIVRDESMVSIHYMRQKLASMSPTLQYRALRLLLSLSPRFLRSRAFPVLDSRTTIFVRSKPFSKRFRLSVIVPAYNEAVTFPALIERLLAKTIKEVEIEVIIVESNSTDGTREQVLSYRDHPRVKVILEERPQGKGHAVRKGLEAATGDAVLFQDADLEYDVDDYDALLEPLMRFEQNFVIGSRHVLKGRVWKIRQFNNAAGMAALFNLGHVFFLGLFNLIYRQKLMDPFSMFKVFRRECLYGLTFECNRFDFDFEITIKLLRKGYRPVELPVNYTARSFAEGKKVSVLRDPLTWLKALVKFRNSRLYI